MKDVTAAARKLSQNVIQQCIGTLEPSIMIFVVVLLRSSSSYEKWILQDVLLAPISYAAYSCNSQLIFASFCDANKHWVFLCRELETKMSYCPINMLVIRRFK
ncbi:hypothetical protein RYX36_010248 [Vicia faba]